jgi:hypothetical protein
MTSFFKKRTSTSASLVFLDFFAWFIMYTYRKFNKFCLCRPSYKNISFTSPFWNPFSCCLL